MFERQERFTHREEDRIPLVRPLEPVAALGHAVGVRRPAPVHRPRRRRRGARRRRRLLPGAPLRPPARLAVPAARRGRRAHEPDRDRHRRDRHALREPALHGRGRRAPPTSSPAAGCSSASAAGHPSRSSTAGATSATSPPRATTDADMAREHTEVLLEVLKGEGFAEPNPRPMFPNPPGLLRVEPHSPGLRDRIWWGAGIRRDRRVGRRAGHEPDELDAQGRRDRRALPRPAARADRALPRRVDGGRPRARAPGLGQPQHLPHRQRPGPRLLRPRRPRSRPGRPHRRGTRASSAGPTPPSPTQLVSNSPRTRRSPPPTPCCSRCPTSSASTTTRTCSRAS